MATHQPQDAVTPEHTRYPTTATQGEKRPFLNDAESSEPSLPTQRPQPRSRIMPSARGLIIALFCLLVTFSLTLALTDDPRPVGHGDRDQSAAQPASGDATTTDVSTLQSLLDAVSPESLHELLHRYFPGRYQHGVWPSDRAAVEAVAVHPEDGPSLVRLLRRDNSTTSTTSSTSESPVPSSTTTTPLPTSTTTTTSGGGPTSSSSTGASPPSSAPSTTSRSSPIPSSSSSATPTTTTQASTTPPSRTTSRRSQTTVFTSFVDGKPTIVTQTTFVDPIGGAEQSTIEASLQTNAAVAPGRRSQGLVDAAVAGAVVVGGVLLI